MKRWNDDYYTKKARRENFLARSVFKLEEIDKREKLFTNAINVLDLGSSPGSWTQYCLQKNKLIQVVAVDLNPMRLTDPRVTFIQTSIESADIVQAIGDRQFDLVLSDMAPKTSGIHDTDVARSVELATQALCIAKSYLRPGGHLVVKLFMGEGFEAFHATLKMAFQSVRLLKPESTRKHSREIYFIARHLLAK